jgi:hypothetical protein
LVRGGIVRKSGADRVGVKDLISRPCGLIAGEEGVTFRAETTLDALTRP